jgi:hypothetical protein
VTFDVARERCAVRLEEHIASEGARFAGAERAQCVGNRNLVVIGSGNRRTARIVERRIAYGVQLKALYEPIRQHGVFFDPDLTAANPGREHSGSTVTILSRRSLSGA